MMKPLAANALDKVDAFQFRSWIALSKISLSFFSNSLDIVRTRQGQTFVGGWPRSPKILMHLPYREVIVIAVNKFRG